MFLVLFLDTLTLEDWPEMSQNATNPYQSALRKIPEEQSFHLKW